MGLGQMRTSGNKGPATAQDRAVSIIRTAMIEKKINQAELADAADCHEKTVQNLLAGKSVREQTLFDVCMVLGLDYEALRATYANAKPGGVAITGERALPPAAASPASAGMGGDIAPVYMGAYTRDGVDHYIGSYLTLRPNFARADHIMAYRTDIAWDAAWPSLTFDERDRPDADYAHRGRVYIPASSMYIHLVSLTKGAMRMIVASQPDRLGTMRGIITTQHKAGAMLVPVATPIVYARRASFDAVHLGEITPTEPAYDAYHAMLRETVDEGYARLLTVAIRPPK